VIEINFGLRYPFYLQFLEKCGDKLSENSPAREYLYIKFFVIIISLIEELEVKKKKLVHQNNTIASGGSDMTDGLEHRAINEKLAKSLLLVLVTYFFLCTVTEGSLSNSLYISPCLCLNSGKYGGL
jgi:hypothetical protein